MKKLVMISGMQDVTEIGTARAVRIPGINMCAKTGTAENYLVVEHRRTKLKNNAMFVCFAPRENPKIAIAVVVSNAGFGATWAAPIGSLIAEKYLNDSLRPESVKKAEQIAGTDLMPKYLVRLQFLQDSTNAAKRALQTHDSTRLMKYITPSSRAALLDTLRKTIAPPSSKNPMIKPKEIIKPKVDSCEIDMNQRNAGITKGIDWPLVWIWAILCCIGVTCIFAATYRDTDNILQGFISLKTDYSRELLYFIMGGIVGVFILLTDSKFFTATANLGYAFGIFLMLLVFVFHSKVKGTGINHRGRFGNLFQLQPAEALYHLCKSCAGKIFVKNRN